MSNGSIPAAEADDGAAVAFALAAARAELNQGSPIGAAQWLRRAAVAAQESGDSERSLALEAVAARYAESSAPAELSDIDEFSDETIVDQVPDLAGLANGSAAARGRERGVGSVAHPVTTIATPPTPVAQPLRPAPEPSIYPAVRVAVRRALGGTWQVRPLSERESAPVGEEEALLVPLRPGVKFG